MEIDDGEIKEILKGIKGFRDYYPEYFANVNYILNVMHKISKRFGYEEYEGPSLEYAKLIEIKSGQAILDETFLVQGKDEKKLVLRPEQTPTLARMVVNEQQRYAKPMRWYSIPRIFRNETPQKGRVREFFQYNADIIGSEHVSADAEIIAVTVNIIKEAGLKDEEFICVINSRELFQGFLEHLKIDNYVEVIKIIDSKDKFLQEFIENELVEKGVTNTEAKELSLWLKTIYQQDTDGKTEKIKEKEEKCPIVKEYVENLNSIAKQTLTTAFLDLGISKEQTEQLVTFSSIKGEPRTFIDKLRKMEIGEKANKALDNLEELIEYLELFEVAKNCEYNAAIARGLDYYTGIVFEFYDQTGSVARAIAGGGRYDQLVETFGGGKIAAVGIGMGETVIMSILQDLGRLPEFKNEIDMCVVPIKKEQNAYAAEIANLLRTEFNVVLNLVGWNIRRHLEDADIRKIPYMIVVGKQEENQKTVTIQNLYSREKETIDIAKLVERMKNLLVK